MCRTLWAMMRHSHPLQIHKTAATLMCKELHAVSWLAASSLHRLISCAHLYGIYVSCTVLLKEFHWKRGSLMRLLSVITRHECSAADRWDFICPPQSKLTFRSRRHVSIRQHLKVWTYGERASQVFNWATHNQNKYHIGLSFSEQLRYGNDTLLEPCQKTHNHYLFFFSHSLKLLLREIIHSSWCMNRLQIPKPQRVNGYVKWYCNCLKKKWNYL